MKRFHAGCAHGAAGYSRTAQDCWATFACSYPRNPQSRQRTPSFMLTSRTFMLFPRSAAAVSAKIVEQSPLVVPEAKGRRGHSVADRWKQVALSALWIG